MTIRQSVLTPNTASVGDTSRAIVYMCLACLFWAALELFGGYIPSNYSALETVWVRYGVHLVFMLLVFGPSYRTKLLRTNSLKLQLFRPVLMIGMPLFFLLGVRFMPAQDVWAVFWVTPLMVMGLGRLFLNEHVALPNWIATAIGLGGIYAIFHPAVRFLMSWTIVLPLATAFCFSLYVVLTKMLHGERTLTNLFYTAFVVFLPWSFGLPHFWQTPTPTAMIAMSAVGLLGFATLYFLDKAQQRAATSALAPFLYAQPVFVVLLSVLVLHQSPGISRWLGSSILVGIGIFLVMIERFQNMPAGGESSSSI